MAYTVLVPPDLCLYRSRVIMSSETVVSAPCNSSANDSPQPNFDRGLAVSFVPLREHPQDS